MVAIATVIAVTITAVARLVTVVRADRAPTQPRSHTHELDPQSARLLGVV